MTTGDGLDASKPLTPAELGRRYELLALLGAGGVGTVHRARELATGRVVALKQLHVPTHQHGRQRLEAMFEREYHTLARLQHPRVIEVYDFGRTAQGPYYSMELLSGADLQTLAPLPAAVACRHLRDVASSLALLHTHRLVHRDISPGNVRLTADGRAKVIDFGALHGFGVANDVIGTAPCVAPELLGRMPLDARSDLFSLGAVAYWALTRRHAYPVRRIEELPQAWLRAPLPPSRLAPNIPAELDALVLSLLSIDPLCRPSSSSEVIERLTAIAQLPPEERGRTEESYLDSSRMAGREAELKWLHKQLEAALRGRGGEVVVEAPPGAGKTRLMHELALGAQLAGAAVLRSDAEPRAGGYAVANQLALHLLTVCPEAEAHAAAFAAVLSHLSPALQARLKVAAPPPLPSAASESRARMQQALHGWFLATCRARPLLIIVDDLHAADDASAAFLAALGRDAREHPLLLICTQRTGAKVHAAVPVSMLRERATPLKLGALDAAAVREFLGSVFGATEHLGSLAKLLHRESGGNAQLCVEFARLLIRKRIAKYADGSWIVPANLSTAELPARADGLLAARLNALGPHARRLSEALCVHRWPVDVDLCLALFDGPALDAHAALDELTAEQVLQQVDDEYRFAHEALRETQLRRLAPELARARHRSAGETLLARATAQPALQLSAALHLMRAGEEQRAARLIAELGRAALRGPGSVQDCGELLEALQAAVVVYERAGAAPEQLAGVLLSMVSVAYQRSSDWRLLRTHGERAIELGAEITGLARARRLRPVLGKRLALAVGLGVAGLRFARLRKRGLGYDLPGAIQMLCGALPGVHGTFALCLDAATCARLCARIEALTYFGADHLVMLAYDYCAQQLAWLQGRLSEYRAGLARSEARIVDPKLVARIGDDPARIIHGAIVWTRALLDGSGFGPAGLRGAERLERFGDRWLDNGADQVRMLIHTTRGESERARHFQERIELFALQGGTTWQLHLVAAPMPLSLDLRIGDALAARSHFEQLARLAVEIPSLRPYAAAAEAACLALRGQLQAAAALYERVLPQIAPRASSYWLAVRASFAQVLNWDGQHERARSSMLEALDTLAPDCEAFIGDELAARGQLALAEAGLGRSEHALRQIEPLLQRYGAEDHPLFVGGLHQVRAEIALEMRDAASLSQHVGHMERCYRETRNPALVAQCERLSERAIEAGLLARPARAMAFGAQASVGASANVRAAIAQLHRAPDPCQAAIALSLQLTRASAAYLYLFERAALRLMASSAEAPPPQREAELLQELLKLEFEDGPASELGAATSVDTTPLAPQSIAPDPARSEVVHDARTQPYEPPPAEVATHAYRSYPLSGPLQYGPPIGALLLALAAGEYRPPSESWLEAIALALSTRHAANTDPDPQPLRTVTSELPSSRRRRGPVSQPK